MDRLVYILDTGARGAASAATYLGEASIASEAFETPASLFEAFEAGPVGCVVVDAEPRGADILAGFRLRKVGVPVIIVSESANVESAVRALRHGAFDYIETPLHRQRLIDSVNQALGMCAVQDNPEPVWSETRSRLDRLTAREQEVLELVVHGDSNRLIAAKLQLSPKTIEVHRSRVMRKMQSPSLAHLVGTVRCFQCTRWPGPVD